LDHPPEPKEKQPMSDNVYRVIEVVGSSAESIDDAIRGGIARVAQTTRGLDWFEVKEIRGHIEDGAVAHYQVGLKVGFRIEDPA
jgi:flavin-binding protein dodecin